MNEVAEPTPDLQPEHVMQTAEQILQQEKAAQGQVWQGFGFIGGGVAYIFGYVGLMVNGKSAGQLFTKPVENVARNNDIKAAQADSTKLAETAKNSATMLFKDSAGNYTQIPIAQEQQRVAKQLTAYRAQPETTRSESGTKMDQAACLIPAVALFFYGLYKSSIGASRYKKAKQELCETPAGQALQLNGAEFASDIIRKADAYATTNSVSTLEQRRATAAIARHY